MRFEDSFHVAQDAWHGLSTVGQAVLEGVMMRGHRHVGGGPYAILRGTSSLALRRFRSDFYGGLMRKIPLLRGMVDAVGTPLDAW